ncbi:MAG: acyl-[acyl-carrier-protein] thioesterase [Lachnospiraceae bacterium]|nr:acyl-[acyl-carrier-protein] thioesterase [Lachnospiraceae bacterium]
MYSFQSRVRYSEVGVDQYLTLPSILNYYQDCSNFQSEEYGVGIDYLTKQRSFWVVSSWQVKILRRPKLGEEITIGTWPHALKGFFGLRNFVIRDREGNDLAQAETVWTYLDMDKMRPKKVEDNLKDIYKLEDPIPGEWKGRKIPKPEGGEEMEPITVGKFLLDTNGHVNNEKYVLIAMEYVPKDFQISYLRVEYKAQARYKDVIVPVVTKTEDVITVSLNRENGETFTVIEFERGTKC